MKRSTSIQLKATFLLLVFALNTLVGSACAMGVNMGFNASHHEEVTAVSIHVHADGKKHEHPNKANKHHHDKEAASKKDGCCNDKVISLQNLDKNLVQNINATVDVPVITLNSFFGTNIFQLAPIAPQKFIVPTSHPPPCDICIAIGRFQI